MKTSIMIVGVGGQGTLLASAFHPEMTGDRRVQEYFLKMVEEARAGR